MGELTPLAVSDDPVETELLAYRTPHDIQLLLKQQKDLATRKFCHTRRGPLGLSHHNTAKRNGGHKLVQNGLALKIAPETVLSLGECCKKLKEHLAVKESWKQCADDSGCHSSRDNKRSAESFRCAQKPKNSTGGLNGW
jgi:hypothetical protein